LRYRELKKRVREALDGAEMEDLASLIEGYPRALSALMSLTYDKRSEITWKAIEAIGPIVNRITERSYDSGREIVRRLIWSITEESGGIGWSALEMLGEIVKNCPGRFDDLIPIIREYYEEEIFRPGVLYAIRRIGERDPGLLEEIGGLLEEALKDKDPYIRAQALMCLGVLEFPEKKELMMSDLLKKLSDDDSSVWLFRLGEMGKYKIGQIARELSDRQD
jgi:hypothetical protein